MNPHYYVMKNKKILRLEENDDFESLPIFIKNERETFTLSSLGQSEANWRVALFRETIMEIEEYCEYLQSSEYHEEKIQFQAECAN